MDAAVDAVLAVLATALLPRPKSQEIEMSRDEDIGQGITALPPLRWVWLMQAAYFCAGFSNTLNVTFTSLITELQPLDGWGAKMWMLVGLAATPAPFIWDRIARRIGRMDALRAAFVLNIAGNLCLALTFSLATTALAAILFGFTFMGIVSLTLSTVGRAFGNKATQIMARMTLGYCVAQILSPVMGGIIAELTGSFRLPLYLVSAIMIAGLLCLIAASREHQVRL